MTQLRTRSLWQATSPTTAYPQLDGELDVDVAVIGGGIVGVTAAHLLVEAGRSVALLELGRLGQGTTGLTTAKLTVGHGLVYARLRSQHGREAARLYAESNRAAIAAIEERVRTLGVDCDWEPADNVVYTERAERVADLREEAEAMREAGVGAELETDVGLPFPVAAAIRVGGQAQFHPLRYLQALAARIRENGGLVFESTRASGVETGALCTVRTATGVVRARHVVVATQLPFLDRGLFFARAHPVKSYAVSAPVGSEEAPRGMYLSVGGPTRSIRSAPGPDGSRHLIVGGEGHKPGAEPDTERRYRALEAFLRERFGVEGAEHRWSAHDFVPVDGLPFIGRLRPGSDRVLTATGFAKWGLTKGTFAASMLADAILGRPSPWAELYDATRTGVRSGATKLALENAEVAARFAGERLRPRPGREDVDGLAPGEGTVARVRGRHYAVHRDDTGKLHVLSARCPHLGCLVGWSSADRTWECPCHGSRFAADGTLLQGPATRDLGRRSLPAD
ncbi:MAG TPA: FAD-dependent oxidoreductase [Gaiellaceae bacterium]|nr:FAD-dependent oxidoreductase [Gaiellaceae bacterium]